jgi:hypothetical protein
MNFTLFAVVLLNFVSISEIKANSVTIETAMAEAMFDNVTCYQHVVTGFEGPFKPSTVWCESNISDDSCIIVENAIQRNNMFFCDEEGPILED